MIRSWIHNLACSVNSLYLKKKSAGRHTASAVRRFACIISLLACALYLLPFVSTASAASVTMAWDPNQENDLAGYRLHYGSASRDYSQVIDVGNINQYKVSGLLAGTTYYFAITAYNLQGMDSDYSAELAHTTSVTTYTITALAGDNGSITPAGTVTVNQGTNQTFSMHPDQNFQVLNVKVDGVSLGTIKNYTFTDISADHTIEAEFAYIGPAPSPDSDNDGMPDDWEILHGLDPLENDAAGDPDADGISNLNEYLGGTAPNSYDKILNSVQPQLFLLLMSE